jgi:fatty-acid desaturase
MNDSLKLFVLQAVAHVGLLLLILFGSSFDWIVCLLVYFVTGCFGVTMTYHRLLSHRAWLAPKWWGVFGPLCGVWGAVGSPIAWVATHRAHHRDADGLSDPHSPIHRSWWRVQWLSMFDASSPKFAVDLLRSNFHVFLHRRYFTIHIVCGLLLFLIDPWLVVIAYLAPAAVLWNAGSLINTVGHLWGYRNHSTKDNSHCNPILGFFIFGEGWHNNHHASPASPSFQYRWWEFDIGYFLIRLLDNANKRTSANGL